MTKLTRRGLLKGTAATALGLSLPMPFISRRRWPPRARSWSAWKPARPTTPSTRRTPPNSPRRPASRSSSSRSRTTISASSSCSTALSGAGGFDVYIADQVWLPEFYEKGFIRDLSGLYTDADKADFSKTAIETVTYDGALVALPIMVHNCAMYYRTDLFEAGCRRHDLGRVSRLRQDGRRAASLGHHGLLQAGHRGRDPAPLVLSAGGRRSARGRRHADDQLRCRPGRARVHDVAGVRGQVGARGRARTARHAGPLARGQAGDGAGLAVPLLAQQGAARRQVRHRHRARPHEPRRHRLFVGLCRRQRRQEPRRRRRVHQVGDEHRHALRLWQGMAEPGAARLGDRPHQRRRLDQRRRQGGDRGLRDLGRRRQEHDDGAAILAAPRRPRHHAVGRDVQGDDHRPGAGRWPVPGRSGDGS